MKPMYEKVLPTENSSWRYWLYALDEIPFNWHYHPEYEICLTLNSRGQRYIGDNIANYNDLDLVLLGPKLPHTWHSKELVAPGQHLTYVAQLPTSWIDSVVQMPELKPLGDLLAKSKRGVEFGSATAQQCRTRFEAMADATPMQRLLGLLEILSTTDFPVSAISYSCGFNNISNFNRRFLQLKQCTPREFKRSYQKM